MFDREQINKELEIEKVEVEKVTGKFKTDDGREIDWKGFRLKTKINGVVYKWKLEKVFNDTFEEMLNEEE